ncbi:MAG TPA: hypothetical protein VMM82_15475 [Spirochaetia bacterium]|nr:hypothetical protein [Spirochaetia bacterium]
MAELLRCKTCGYVVEADRVGDVCPACGVARKMMEPWKDPLSPQRRFLLGLDVHPIIDHFSISFATCAAVVAAFVLLFPDVLHQTSAGVMRVFVGVLPLAVLASYLSGVYDGKLRFRRTSTPVLRSKKLLGALFFAFTVIPAVLCFFVDPSARWAGVSITVLEILGLGCAFLLGRAGKDLLGAFFPG